MIAVSLLIVAGLAASWFVAGALIAPLPRPIGQPPGDLRVAEFSVASESGSTISGWYTPGESGKGVVVLLHGIWGSRLSMLDRARMLHQAGYATVMFDFQAHGESPGNSITIGHLERHDVRAAVQFARGQFPDQPIGVIGVSLGGAAALLASPLDIDALVVESVYPDIYDAVHNRVANRLGPFSTLPASLLLWQLEPRLGISPDSLCPIQHMPNIECPIFVLSGTEDRHTTAAETQAMYSAALSPKQLWMVEGAGHVDLLEYDPSVYRTRVVGFFDQYLGGDDVVE